MEEKEAIEEMVNYQLDKFNENVQEIKYQQYKEIVELQKILEEKEICLEKQIDLMADFIDINVYKEGLKMLKIKDSIDLKELEKFGFTYRKHYKNYTKLHSYKDYEDYVDNYIQVDNDRVLKPYTRILNGHNTEYCDKSQTNIKDEFLNTIYDLIQAGLVEKV